MPTGPIIIVITTLFIALSLLFSPKYGVISRYGKKLNIKKRLKISSTYSSLLQTRRNSYFEFANNQIESFYGRKNI
ncbi:hypothetical protein ACEW7V_03230 [Areca yellow leaf disease phytoplasma]|uniref:hypothetical protein n=1 Tax=Areca yellow leaf disease phytoplasma TaxID=927614 RepID=UPI0035B52955